MPRFELVSRSEAELKTAKGKRAEIAKEYLGYIDQLREGQAGCLQPAERERGSVEKKTRSSCQTGRERARDQARR